jgi:glucose/arabinose dehydrogenase
MNNVTRFACATFVTAALSASNVACKLANTSASSVREVPFKEQAPKIIKSGYALDPADSNCGGFPMLRVETMPGTCLGMVKQSDDSTFQPRVIIEIPGRKNEFLITDFANWDYKNGKIWYLKTTGNYSTTIMTPVLTGLSVPHQITVGPDNHIFFAEDGRIRSFPVSAIKGSEPIPASAVTDAITGLPQMFSKGQKNSMHPLKHFVFDAQFNIYVNIGAYTDHCSDFKGKECLEADIAFGTAGTTDVREHGAVIRKYKFNGSLGKKWDSNYSIVARGLRNSMGLLFTSNGDLIQVENGRDFNESSRPLEELNVIRKADLDGKGEIPHYGWPYCYDYNSTSEEWTNFSFSCDPSRNKTYRPPYVFLPPHSAPLGIIKYTGGMFPQLRDKFLVALHGYRSAGHRIVAFKTDSSTGLPIRTGKGSYRDDDNSGGTTAFIRAYPEVPAATESEDVIYGWYDAPRFRPRGAPVAITQASDGSIWIADDKSRAILRLATPVRETPALAPAPRPNFAKAYSQIIAETPEFRKAYDAMVNKVIISPQCEGCHDNYINTGDSQADGLHHLRYILAMGNWAIPADLQASTLYTKMSPPMKSAMPPIDKPYPNLQTATEALETVKAFVMAMPKRENLWKVKSGQKPTIKGLRKGEPGNGICGTLAADSYLLAVSNNPATLGGQKMLEVLLLPQSKLLTEKTCSSYNSFYVPMDSLEKLLD